MAVIGLDFGNYKTFTCFISDMDENTRKGGNVHDLIPGRLQTGIPSVYFYSQREGELIGENGERPRARPVANRLRYLERNLGKSIVLDDRTVAYDDAITSVVQHCVRQANELLQQGWLMTTNQVALAYPAAYKFAQLEHLVNLVEKATLANGEHLKVVGTIREPAAAALDYLSEFAKTDKDTVVMTYDLGGGTFDLAIVAAYPGGRTNRSGYRYFYDIIDTDGMGDIGGADFDRIMAGLMESRVNTQLQPAQKDTIAQMSESAKIELSSDDISVKDFFDGEEYINIRVSRQEFEDASKDLLQKTIERTVKLVRKHPECKPDLILLTGGASQMPMVQKELEKALPEYRGRIMKYRPAKAIAYGAARFGVMEENPDPMTNPVLRRVQNDIGVKYYQSFDDDNGYIVTYIKAGTEIPCESEYHQAGTAGINETSSRFEVYEAVKPNPVSTDPDHDYTEIMEVTLEFGKEVAPGTRSESRLVIDQRGMLVIEAQESGRTNPKAVRNSVKLKNLSEK